MPSCEKCWKDAHRGPQFDVADEYFRLRDERADDPCTPEEQAGEDAGECLVCGRMARHQHCGVCMNCGHENSLRGHDD